MSFIVVGVDGSASAYKALSAAVKQAELAGAEVRALNVIVLPAMSGYEYGPINVDAMTDAAQNTVNTAIAKLAAEYGGELPVPVSTHTPTGHVGIELLRAAKKDGGALMVVAGSRGYGGIRSLLLGSVTTYLAHHLECPLLIIPAADEDE